MGKASRKKKLRRRKLKYNKSEFIGIFCSKCMLCPRGSEPSFCFEQVYKKNPKLFVQVIFNHLLELTGWVFDSHQDFLKDVDDINTYIFKHAFCSSGICGKKYPNGCEMQLGCLAAFKAQVSGEEKVKITTAVGVTGKKKKKLKRKHKQRYVAKPYPTFFCNEPFKSEIEGLLNEDNDKQQDKAAESSGLPEASASGTVEGGEPQVPGGPGRW